MAYGATLTLPTITGSHSDFKIKLVNGSFPVSAIDGGASSILNGGGNLRAYTDSTKAIQIPLSIITFVTGGSPDIDVDVLLPSAFTAATIFIEADSVATTQPAVTDTYGRNSTYDVRHNLFQYFNQVPPIDLSGQQVVSATGSPTSNGESITFNGTSQCVSSDDDTLLDGQSAFTLYADYDPTATGDQYLSWKRGVAGGYSLVHKKSSNQLTFTILGVAEYNISASFFNRGRVYCVVDGTSLEIFLDGVSQGTATISASRPLNTNEYHTGCRTNSSGVIDGYSGQEQWGSRYYKDALSSDYIATEYDNEINAGSWVSVGAWADSGGGISVTGATASYDYSGIVGSIDLTGEVIVTGSTGSYDYTGITATIELGTEIIVTGQTASYNYTGVDGSVELTGLITVLGQTANYDYDGIAADITLQGSIIVSGSTANYDYNALNATIILQGPITINPKNIVRVKRKSNTIQVKRNSNIIRVR